jgi:hypothetical protein
MDFQRRNQIRRFIDQVDLDETLKIPAQDVIELFDHIDELEKVQQNELRELEGRLEEVTLIAVEFAKQIAGDTSTQNGPTTLPTRAAREFIQSCAQNVTDAEQTHQLPDIR